MNRLHTLSERGRKQRVFAALCKFAIAGSCAVAFMFSVVRFGLNGGITLAVETPDASSGHIAEYADGVPYMLPAAKSPTLAARPESEFAAAVLSGTQTDTASAERPAPLVEKPDGFSGWAVKADENGDLAMYGQPIPSSVGHMQNRKTGTFGGTVEAGRVAADDYFSDAIFIGNSLVVGMQKCAQLDTSYYANIGLSVRGFFEKSFIPMENGEKVTAAEALVRDDDFRKIYLMFGINELGWPSVSGFISYYEAVIDAILAIHPDTVIYVQKLLPMNEAVYRAAGNATDTCNNARIAEFNAALDGLAERKQVFLLNPGEAVADETGSLPAEATSDGIHLNSSYIRSWVNYLRTHTVDAVYVPEA